MTLLLIILLVILLLGGIPAWRRRDDLGVGPSGIIGVLLVVLVVVLIFRLV